MSNTVFEDKMYNESIKRKYIDEHKRGTQKNLERIFKITRAAEEDLSKDLYSFTREELLKTFYTFQASTPAASKSTVQYVSGYIEWAIDMGYRNGLNPLYSVDTKWKEQFVIRPEKVYFTDVEIKDMLKDIVEPQVAVVFYAPFLGIRGDDNAEIVNLRQEDIDTTNKKATLRDKDGNERVVKIDNTFINLCNQSLNNTEYAKSNGNPDANLRAQETAYLVSNSYVVRSIDNANTIHTNEADGAAVHRRFELLKKVFDHMDVNITPTSVMRSGMLSIANKMLQKGELNEDGYAKIAKQFNINDMALKRYRLDFLNEESVDDLYNK